jgi:hypothetical protein
LRGCSVTESRRYRSDWSKSSPRSLRNQGLEPPSTRAELSSNGPGDVIATGTPPGVGLDVKPTPVFLREGKTVGLGIEGLGEQLHKTVQSVALSKTVSLAGRRGQKRLRFVRNPCGGVSRISLNMPFMATISAIP